MPSQLTHAPLSSFLLNLSSSLAPGLVLGETGVGRREEIICGLTASPGVFDVLPHLPAPPALGTSGEGWLWDSSWICFWSLKSRPHPLPHQNSASLFQALRFYWSQFLSVSFVFWPLPLFIETFRRFCCAVLRELVDLVFLVFVSNLGKQWVSNKIVFAFSNPLISRPNRKMERSFWCGIKKLHS